MRIALWINELLIAMIALIAMTPIVYNNLAPQIPLVLSIFLFLLALRTSAGYQVIFNKTTKFWYYYYGWQILCFCLGHSSESINNGIMRFCVFTIPFLMPYVITGYVKKGHYSVFVIVSTIIVINVISNISIGINNPEAFAELGEWGPKEVDRTSNKGSTDMVSYCLFFIPICYLLYRHVIVKKVKLITLITIIIIGYLLTVVNSRATALIILLLMMFFLIMTAKGFKFKRKQIIVVILFLIVALFMFANTPLGQMVVDLASDSKKLSGRFQDILIILQGGGLNNTENGSLASRLMLSGVSLSTFFDSIPNFIFGIGEDLSGKDLYDLVKTGVGQHSELFDLAARFGIIGIFMVYKALSATFKFILSLTNDIILRNEVKVIFIFFIIYSFLNNSFFVYTFIVLFWMLPIAVLFIEKYKNNHEYALRNL